MKFQRRKIFVDAVQFDPAVKPWPAGVDKQPCYCAALAQDGRRCEACKPNGRRYGVVQVGSVGVSSDLRRVEIERGDWLVNKGPNCFGYPEYAVMSNAEFTAMYEPAS